MFTFIWADGQASAVESLKTQNSNVKVQLDPTYPTNKLTFVFSFTLLFAPSLACYRKGKISKSVQIQNVQDSVFSAALL